MFVVGHVTLQRWHEIERAARANKRTMSDEIAERLEILAAWSELLKLGKSIFTTLGLSLRPFILRAKVPKATAARPWRNLYNTARWQGLGAGS